jgi:hypothetical protein
MESDQVKDKIIKESIALFLNYGIRSVTMDDIARHLGMSKKNHISSFQGQGRDDSIGVFLVLRE